MNTWDEKNYTEPKKSCLNSNEPDQNDIMRDTRNDSAKNRCGDTGFKKEWKRKCPKCKKDTFHTTKRVAFRSRDKLCHSCGLEKGNATRIKNFSKKPSPTKDQLSWKCPNCFKEIVCSDMHYKKYLVRNNKTCKACTWKNKIGNENYLKRKCPQCGDDILYANRRNRTVCVRRKTVCKQCQNINCSKKLKGVSLENRLGKNKAIKMRKKQSNSLKGLRKSDDWKKKARFRRCEMIQQSMGGGPAYNIKSCVYLDELSNKRGWNLQHAKNGGEVVVEGYFVDAYDKKRNIVVEYDEPHHYLGVILKQKDIDRMNKIIHHLKCKFYRYNEKVNKLIRYE